MGTCVKLVWGLVKLSFFSFLYFLLFISVFKPGNLDADEAQINMFFQLGLGLFLIICHWRFWLPLIFFTWLFMQARRN